LYTKLYMTIPRVSHGRHQFLGDTREPQVRDGGCPRPHASRGVAQNGESVVMISLADWNATEETTYLLSQKINASRLADAIKELDAGNGEEHQLIEP
jgi:hypothetical protein